MDNREFLIWIYDRLVHVHNESVNIDYMCKLRSIIENYPDNKMTPNTGPKITRLQ